MEFVVDHYLELKDIGSATGARTQEQTDIANMWTATAVRMWNQAVQQLATWRHLPASAPARAFAAVGLAGADAFLASWDAKYAYNQWRPVTAIRAGGADGNPATDPHPTWSPAIPTPLFPDCISGHTTYGGAGRHPLAHLVHGGQSRG